jgi:hypothetical protein
MRKFLFLLLAALYACSNAEDNRPSVRLKTTPKSGDDETKVKPSDQPSLQISWQTDPKMSSYHVFYVDPNKQTREIDAVLQGDKGFDEGRLIIDESNMEIWPKTKEQACFYLIAEVDGLRSDPSTRACLIMR